MIPRKPKPQLLVLLTLAATAAGCSYGAFSDLEEKAPAARITQGGDISSATFGDQIAGLDRRDSSGNVVEGGVVAIVGNADAAFASATLSGAGVSGVGNAEPGYLKEQFDSPSKILALAPVPSGVSVSAFLGPYVYIGTTSAAGSTVRVIDAMTFKVVMPPNPYKGPAGVTDFGLSVAAADLGANAGTKDDLAVGARDALVLMRADSWPTMADTVTVSGAPGWPAGEFSVITAGDLDHRATAEDEVAAAIPGQEVVVVHHVGDCFTDPSTPCGSAVVLDAPDGSDGFGEALLIADVDGDGANELAVGSPGNGRVYIYDLEEAHFNGTPIPDPTSIEAAGSGDFGRSLAFGKLDGGDKPLLAVGAPATETGGVTGAGRVYLFDALQQLGEGTVLASPEENMLLGQRLTVVPFRSSGGTATYDLLVASGKQSVFVFFANLTSAHKDIRFR